ncbi:WYL domain-containing protein [Nocardioides sp. dk4132]|uniref:helix-turn-helix transcriptional regulator n=1 Tax=unclassified Nocardioides TaxID=2615069 RepID=UPI00129604A9|nr:MULTISPECIES: YafY family protein [unclassified Nocardioides]MQW77909.1 WYL domain-containing protein [Nocardioides sp. dk4132]QGA09165.1 WYL domain-containing protein [Nocardioides sp. dk884]
MSTAARMLRLLSLLQTHRHWPGPELAARLEVSPRTLRRDVERLRDLGYAVEAARGVDGGYQLQAGGALPPLLLEDEEAVAIAVGLRQATTGSAAGLAETSVQALTKVIALMPPRLRRRMEAVRSQTESPGPWRGAPVLDAGTLTTLAQACRDEEPVDFTYTPAARGGGAAEPSRRRVEPHRLVTLGRRWYLVAYDRDRQDWRSFRVDRIAEVGTTGQRFRRRELPATDAVAFVEAGIRGMPHRYAVRVRVAAPAATVAAAVGQWGRAVPLEDEPGSCVLEMGVDDLAWPVVVLAQVGADFVVESPPELRETVARTAAVFTRAALPGSESGSGSGSGGPRPPSATS